MHSRRRRRLSWGLGWAGARRTVVLVVVAVVGKTVGREGRTGWRGRVVEQMLVVGGR